MSCIAGIVSQHGKYPGNSAKQIRKMIGKMLHRAQDNGVLRSLPDDRGALGAGEINLMPESMTFTSSLDEPPYILFTGALYNERDNGQTDVGLFKEYYEKYDTDGFSKLDGSFSAAIVKKDEEVILVRDHVGAVPLFYGHNNENFIFSTELKGMVDYVQFGVEELPPGCIYSSKKGMSQFDAISLDLPELPETLEETAKVVRDQLIEATKKRIKGCNAISLSGGLDSSIIAAIAKEFDPNIKLFTSNVESAAGPDLANAILMADFLGLEHHICQITDDEIRGFLSDSIWYMESFDEDCISGILSNYFTSKMVKEHSNSVLVGEGADELFGGYRMVLKSPNVKGPEHRERLAKKLLDISYNTALRRLDRGWMANGVDYRTPFLDPRVVQFSQMIPMEWKIYGEKEIEKYVLREAFRDMLPEQIANREKLRFAMGTGMDDVMDRIVTELIDPEEIKARPKAAYGLPFATFKELYYYDEFLQVFPPSYENQTVRWDPFK
jgi:asparagine synthase (glutamine-hydrolysing)